MGRFKRKIIIYEKPWHDPNYDGLRHDRKKCPPPTDKEMFRCTCHTARKMKEIFGWGNWMDNFIDEEGNNKPYQERLIT